MMHESLKQLKELTTKLNEKDKEVIQQKKMYESLVELLPEIIVVHKREEILFINTYGLKVLGFNDKKDVIGKNIFSFIFDNDKSLVKLMLKKINGICRQDDFMEINFVKNNGDILLGEVGASTIMWNGEPAVQSAIRDITHLSVLQKRLANFKFRRKPLDGGLISPEKSYILSDGWAISVCSHHDGDKHFDAFDVTAKRGCELHEHFHNKKEYITVCEGSIIVFLENETEIFHEGNVFEIEALEKHKFVPLKDSKLLVSFSPLVSESIKTETQ